MASQVSPTKAYRKAIPWAPPSCLLRIQLVTGTKSGVEGAFVRSLGINTYTNSTNLLWKPALFGRVLCSFTKYATMRERGYLCMGDRLLDFMGDPAKRFTNNTSKGTLKKNVHLLFSTAY